MADGIREYGEAEGRKGNIIKEIRRGYSVDFVTKAGAGGMIISESGDGGYFVETTTLYGGNPTMAETNTVDQAELDRLIAENKQLCLIIGKLVENVFMELKDIQAFGEVMTPLKRTVTGELFDEFRLLFEKAGVQPIGDIPFSKLPPGDSLRSGFILVY